MSSRAETKGRPRSVVQRRLHLLVEALDGRTKVAHALRVSPRQVGAWLTGEELPSPETAVLIVDLDGVLARAQLLRPLPVARQWLNGSDPSLGGGTPLEILRLRGSTEVIEALDAVTAGASSAALARGVVAGGESEPRKRQLARSSVIFSRNSTTTRPLCGTVIVSTIDYGRTLPWT
ncbi:antitoxin Xre/MbcA/ParS toxin-binding domain-containing protein [Leifsonia shinshuensis]|uniref:antitoxin Xre/MbcA/ParS toxin-binding domain-containing protein n=1 Tax=Leifsonia shinshuensis TaxID=150026 RepID=UPI0035EC02CF